jgi:hypothetical protein
VKFNYCLICCGKSYLADQLIFLLGNDEFPAFSPNSSQVLKKTRFTKTYCNFLTILNFFPNCTKFREKLKCKSLDSFCTPQKAEKLVGFSFMWETNEILFFSNDWTWPIFPLLTSSTIPRLFLYVSASPLQNEGAKQPKFCTFMSFFGRCNKNYTNNFKCIGDKSAML